MTYQVESDDYADHAMPRRVRYASPGEWPTATRDLSSDEHQLLSSGTAACKGDADPDRWFTGASTLKERQRLTAVCRQCPLRSACLDYALTHNVDGFWAGTTQRERATRRVAQPTPLAFGPYLRAGA